MLRPAICGTGAWLAGGPCRVRKWVGGANANVMPARAVLPAARQGSARARQEQVVWCAQGHHSPHILLGRPERRSAATAPAMLFPTKIQAYEARLDACILVVLKRFSGSFTRSSHHDLKSSF